MSVKLTSGRCRCMEHGRRPVVWQWKAGKGRRLFNAHCTYCGNRLVQTCVPNMKNPVIMSSEPVFSPESWEDDTGDFDEGMAQGGDAYNDVMYGESPDY